MIKIWAEVTLQPFIIHNKPLPKEGQGGACVCFLRECKAQVSFSVFTTGNNGLGRRHVFRIGGSEASSRPVVHGRWQTTASVLGGWPMLRIGRFTARLWAAMFSSRRLARARKGSPFLFLAGEFFPIILDIIRILATSNYSLIYSGITWNTFLVVHSASIQYVSELSSFPRMLCCVHVIHYSDIALTSNSLFKALRGMMACFYVFNIQHTKALNMPLVFIQHFVFGIKEEYLPTTVTKFISSVDRL